MVQPSSGLVRRLEHVRSGLSDSTEHQLVGSLQVVYRTAPPKDAPAAADIDQNC